MAINWRSDLFVEEYERIKAVSIRKIHKVRDFMSNALINVLFYKTNKPDQWREICNSVMVRVNNVRQAFIEYTGIEEPPIDILSVFKQENLIFKKGFMENSFAKNFYEHNLYNS